MSLFKIAFSNIKKRKGGAVTLLCMIIIASIMLMVGLNLVLNLSSFYDQKVEELNGAHFLSFVTEAKWSDDALMFADSYDGVESAEVENTLDFSSAKIEMKGKATATSFRVYNIDSHREIAPLIIIDKLGSVPENAIVAPLDIKINGGYRAGDNFSVQINTVTYNFTIYGFIEDTMCGNTMMSIRRFYVDGNMFSTLSNDNSFEAMKTFSVRFYNLSEVRDFEKAYKKIIFGSQNDIYSMNYELGKTSTTTFLSLMGAMVVAFAIIIFGIAIIIIRFNIINNISEDIKNFGALKSVGYTTKQIIVSLILQYLLIAVIACIAGSVISILIMPLIGNVVASNSGLLWLSGISFLPLLLTAVAILGITVLIAYLTGRKSKTITPVNALRQGLDTHNYSKNNLPISKTKIPLQLNLGFKNLINNMKNNFTIFIVVAVFAFACILGNVLQYNFGTDKSALIQMAGSEDTSVSISFFADNNDSYIQAIQNDERVNKTVAYEDVFVSCGDIDFMVTVSDDFSRFNTNTIFKGRYPQSHNQISISGVVSKAIGKAIGDIVTIELGNEQRDFLVTGITQGMNENGMVGNLTTTGFKTLNPDFKARSLYVYLYDNNDIESFVEYYGEALEGRAVVLDWEKLTNAFIDPLGESMNLVVILIIITTIIIISLVLFLLISTLIRKNKKSIGIMKALGYSNFQLMRQIVYTFMPIVIIGSVVGIIMGFFITNSVLTVMLTSAGALSVNFIIPVLSSILIGFAMIALNLVITALVSLRIKNISAYKLIVE